MLSCSPEPASLVGPGAPGADQRAADCKAAKTYADQLVTAKYGKQLPTKPFSQGDNAPSEQLSCLDHLWTGESEWDDWAKNPGSWAYGIPQYDLPTGHPYNYGDWKAQIDWGTKYIWGSSSSTGRYGTPCNAYGFWLNQSPHWY